MIEGHCFTNLDEYKKFHWPDMFVAVPRIGDFVETACGATKLRVVAIIHAQRKHGFGVIPVIRIELHM